MNSPLEQYLSEIARRLKPLPARRRDEEITEMRQHLLDAVAVNRELGQSPEEAVGTALEQFGKPGDIAENTMRAWRRDRSRDRRSFWAGFLCMPVLVFVSVFVLSPHLMGPFVEHARARGDDLLANVIGWAFMGANVALCGFLIGIAFPRRAVRSAFWATTMTVVAIACVVAYKFVTEEAYVERPSAMPNAGQALAFLAPIIGTLFLWVAGVGAAAALGAWLGGRLRSRGRRTRAAA